MSTGIYHKDPRPQLYNKDSTIYLHTPTIKRIESDRKKKEKSLEPWRFSWSDSKSPIITASAMHYLLDETE